MSQGFARLQARRAEGTGHILTPALQKKLSKTWKWAKEMTGLPFSGVQGMMGIIRFHGGVSLTVFLWSRLYYNPVKVEFKLKKTDNRANECSPVERIPFQPGRKDDPKHTFHCPIGRNKFCNY